MDEELNQKFRVYEKEIRQIQEQMGAIDQATVDLGRISLGLDDLKGKKNSDILAPVGRGIFIPSKLSSDELIVDVGDGNFIKKTISEAKNMIKDQIDKLDSMRKDLEAELEKIGKDITKTMAESQRKNAEKK
jgi:prefoldin alpha subunit